jgi:ferric-dicitrate binding protein FerR (iron transport regulator)
MRLGCKPDKKNLFCIRIHWDLLFFEVSSIKRLNQHEVKEHIGLHIVNYLLEGEGYEINDSVLIAWLEQDASHRLLFSQYKKIWDESPYYINTEAFEEEKVWNKVNEMNRQRMKRQQRLAYLGWGVSGGVAATVLLLMMFSISGLFTQPAITQLSMSTGYGNRSEILLPDGSKVKLNSGSTISYTYNSQKNVREVEFSGEGFFDVSESDEPFIIKFPHELDIKVLGTSFNLRNYPDDSEIRASLIEGKIEISNQTSTLHIETGEMAVYNKKNRQIKQIEGVLSYTYGWINNKLYMDDMPLSEVCKYIERRYDVSILLDRELGRKIHYNGVLMEESILDVMDALSRLSEINYQVKGRNIQIISK